MKPPRFSNEVSQILIAGVRGRAPIERRQILRSAAAGITGALVFLTSRHAAAWSEESISPDSAIGLAYSNHCAADTQHAPIRATPRERLLNNSALASASQTCPLCGCPIIVTREDP